MNQSKWLFRVFLGRLPNNMKTENINNYGKIWSHLLLFHQACVCDFFYKIKITNRKLTEAQAHAIVPQRVLRPFWAHERSTPDARYDRRCFIEACLCESFLTDASSVNTLRIKADLQFIFHNENQNCPRVTCFDPTRPGERWPGPRLPTKILTRPNPPPHMYYISSVQHSNCQQGTIYNCCMVSRETVENIPLQDLHRSCNVPSDW